MPKKYGLKNVEKDLLYKKYIHILGLTPSQSSYRLKKVNIHLENVAWEMKVQKKSEIEINQRFVEEFEKLIQEIEIKEK